MILRSLCLISISTMTICCHVPNNNLLSLKGTVRLGPTKDALRCECPFPSCQVLSCSYTTFFGTILDNILGKSISRPGSYSIVVTAAVEPATKTVTIPSLILLSSTALEIDLVISIMSFSPLDIIWILRDDCHVISPTYSAHATICYHLHYRVRVDLSLLVSLLLQIT